MTRRTAWTWSAIALAVFVGVAAWLRAPATGADDGAPAASIDRPATAGDEAAATSPPKGATRALPRAAEPVPLPPPGTAPAAVVDALLAAADAGDTRAACRVGIVLVLCQHVEAMSGEVAVRGDLAGTFGQDVADKQAEFDAGIEADYRRCLEIPAGVRARAAELLRTAALAGEPDAALFYAQGLHLMRHTSRDFIAHPGFDAWRAEAVPMLWRAFRAGDERAAALLGMSSLDSFHLLAGLVDDDPVRARAIWLLNARLRGRPMNHRQLAPDAESRAAALAERWHREHFDSRIDETELDLAAITPVVGLPDVPEPERCTGERVR